MSKINVNNIEANDASTDITVTTGGSQSLLVDTNGKLTVAGNLSVNGNNYPSAGPLSNRNLIINGAMQVAQRGTSSTGITSSGYRTVDRYKLAINSSGTWTETQEDDGPSGFTNSLKLECTTADASLGAEHFLFVTQYLEAQNLQHLDYGSSSAKDLTISFWVKSNKTGTYNFEVSHSDASSLSYNINQFTISASATWEHKTLTISGQTTDAIDNNNDRGLSLSFWLAAGSNYNSGTYTADTWSGTDANRAVGQVNLADTVGNYFQITGVQLEVGDTATPFEHRSYGDELARCQRYYEQIDYGVNSAVAVCHAYSTTGSHGALYYTEKRATPSISNTGTVGCYSGTTAQTPSLLNFVSMTSRSVNINPANGMTFGLNDAVFVISDSASNLSVKIDAEL